MKKEFVFQHYYEVSTDGSTLENDEQFQRMFQAILENQKVLDIILIGV